MSPDAKDLKPNWRAVAVPLTAERLLADETFIYLGRRILAGKCCLFLGAGASLSSGAPTSGELAVLLCSQVLMTDEVYSLSEAATYVDAMAGRKAAVEIIVERLKGLSPSPSLRQLTAIPW